MTRVLLLSFFITSCITTTSLASPSDSVLNPGRDAEQERIRRETPPSPFGLTTLILLSALGGVAREGSSFAAVDDAMPLSKETLKLSWPRVSREDPDAVGEGVPEGQYALV